jgi:hypothetical protein
MKDGTGQFARPQKGSAVSHSLAFAARDSIISHNHPASAQWARSVRRLALQHAAHVTDCTGGAGGTVRRVDKWLDRGDAGIVTGM